MTIDTYIENAYLLKQSPYNEDERNIIEDWIICNKDVASRTTFELPIRFVNSYDMNSRIVPIKNDGIIQYYNIVDIASWVALSSLLSSILVDEPNLLKATYMAIKESFLTNHSDVGRSTFYSPKPIFLTNVELEREIEFDEQRERIELRLMIYFHLLHEYSHFLLKPKQKENTLVDFFVKMLFKDIEDNTIGGFSQMILRHHTLDSFKSIYDIPDVREELICDMQGILLIFELSKMYPITTIIESIFAFFYVNIAFTAIKETCNYNTNLELFYLRLNVFIEVADFLTDKRGADLIANSLNNSNRFNKLTADDLFIENKINLNRYEHFIERIKTIIAVDDISDRSYKLIDAVGEVHTLLNDLVFTADDFDAIFFPNYKNDMNIMSYLNNLGLKVLM